jgi:hypothetical protein
MNATQGASERGFDGELALQDYGTDGGVDHDLSG